jgi:3-methyladenine DNA glycosylase AlkD
MTLPWTKQTHPKPAEIRARERILEWAARDAAHPEWFMQKAIAWWLRDLSKRDPERVKKFLELHGAKMRKFAQKEARRLLKPL